MGKSQRLRQSDLRDVYRLLSDVRELRHDQSAMQATFIDTLMRLVGGTCGFCTDVLDWRPDGNLQIASLTADSRSDGAIADLITDLAVKNSFWEDPSFFEGVRQPDAIVATPFHRLISPAELRRRYPFFSDLRRKIRHADHLLGWRRTGPSGRNVFGMAIHRWGKGERPFSERDTALARLVFEELNWLSTTGRLEPAVPGLDELPPRLSEILSLLRSGVAPKQMATQLDLSLYTVRDHIKRLYARLGVGDRNELMALLGGSRSDWRPAEDSENGENGKA